MSGVTEHGVLTIALSATAAGPGLLPVRLPPSDERVDGSDPLPPPAPYCSFVPDPGHRAYVWWEPLPIMPEWPLSGPALPSQLNG